MTKAFERHIALQEAAHSICEECDLPNYVCNGQHPKEVGRQETTPTLDEALENWQVDEPGMWENESGPEGWWAVSNADEAIVAYFAKPADAYRWRMSMINRDINP